MNWCRHTILALLVLLTRGNECVVPGDTMPDHFYTFHTTPEQLRRQGARTGQPITSSIQRASTAITLLGKEPVYSIWMAGGGVVANKIGMLV